MKPLSVAGHCVSLEPHWRLPTQLVQLINSRGDLMPVKGRSFNLIREDRVDLAFGREIKKFHPFPAKGGGGRRGGFGKLYRP